MDELVQMLSESEHNAEVLHSNDASEVKEQVDRKWINMKFINIGTTITFQLDETRSDYISGDYDKGEGKVKFVGKHTLNYEPIWVVMDFDLASLDGKAHLEQRDITTDPTEAEREAAEKKAETTQQQQQKTASTQNKSALKTTPIQSKASSAKPKKKATKKTTTTKPKAAKSKTKRKTTKKATTAKPNAAKSKTKKETADA